MPKEVADGLYCGLIFLLVAVLAGTVSGSFIIAALLKWLDLISK